MRRRTRKKPMGTPYLIAMGILSFIVITLGLSGIYYFLSGLWLGDRPDIILGGKLFLTSFLIRGVGIFIEKIRTA